uniref:Cyclin-dependent kinases regulatory subunit n=1 Tax=Stegastes partitus TaxID=144197 RepID=A0A3B4ZLW7_9TELE
MSKKQIFYSDKYNDDEFEYRHVVLPKELSKLVPTSHLMTEDEWRGLGVQQSQGWIHYMIHKPGQCSCVALSQGDQMNAVKAVFYHQKLVTLFLLQLGRETVFRDFLF